MGKKSVLTRMFLLVAIATALTLGIYTIVDYLNAGITTSAQCSSWRSL
jgi:preprotein translocase subunit SecE